MSNYRRSRTPGATYFFTVVTQGRRPYFQFESARNALRDAVKEVRISQPFLIDAWVLLPDHLHTIWTLPAGDANFSQRWANIKRLTSGACLQLVDRSAMTRRQVVDGENGFWQRRFWEHQIRDDEDLAAHADYIHWNPVKHGLVARAVDWPHSTFLRFVRLDIYSTDWAFAEKEVKASYGE